MTFDLTPSKVSQHINAKMAVVIPIYNEEETIQGVISEWKAEFEKLGINYCFLLINDGSKDNTMDVLRKMEEKTPEKFVIIDKPNAGHGRTCRLGYTAAVGSASVEWILQIDSDGQCDPAYFKEFWEKRTNADCVFGKRVQLDDGPATSSAFFANSRDAAYIAGLPDADVVILSKLDVYDKLGTLQHYLKENQFHIASTVQSFTIWSRK